jgi:hypothetical protein
MRLIASGLLLALAGCAMTSDAIPIGPDTYTITARASPSRGGPGAARPMALQEASAFCARQSRQMLMLSVNSNVTSFDGAGSSDVVFRCLPPGDPELQRPTIRPTPNVVIENRN